MKRIAVIGGGVSGLAAAYALEKHRRNGAELEYILCEAGTRLGGVIRTERVDGFLVEGGPDSFLIEKPWASDLCRELGLGDQLIPSNDSERKTYILVKGRLVPMPDGLMFMVPTDFSAAFFSPLFSWPTKLRVLREWFYRPAPNAGESTVAELVERHYGREMVERIADPLLAGVYGGSADKLSATATLPRFVEMEARRGSLGRAMVEARKLRNMRPLFTTLKDGMQTMTEALARQIPERARRLNTRIDAIRPESGKWLVVSDEHTQEFDAVVLATPAHISAELLHDEIPQIAAELAAISYSSSVIVALAYDAAVRNMLPAGFGFLVPRSEGKRVRACTFVHNKFSERAPEARALLRCFLGGTHDEGILPCSDSEITGIVSREIQEILGTTAEPAFTRIYRWPKAMAQYGVGHKSRVERIRQAVANTHGLAIAGNAYNGIGIPDCVRSGVEASAKISADLAVA